MFSKLRGWKLLSFQAPVLTALFYRSRVLDTYKQWIRKQHSLIPISTCSNLHTGSSLRPCRLEKGTMAICWFCHLVSKSGIINWLFWGWSWVLRLHVALGLGTWGLKSLSALARVPSPAVNTGPRPGQPEWVSLVVTSEGVYLLPLSC